MNHVLVDVRDRIGLITLNKPHKLNAWDRPMREAIVAALQRFDDDAAVGVLAMTGAGDRWRGVSRLRTGSGRSRAPQPGGGQPPGL